MILEINLNPCPAPRQTKRDIWKPSPIVIRYRAWRDAFIYSLPSELRSGPPEILGVLFQIQMPPSWSERKCVEMDGKPHQQKPDLDNLLKAILDAWRKDDSKTWKITELEKRWARKGKILILL